MRHHRSSKPRPDHQPKRSRPRVVGQKVGAALAILVGSTCLATAVVLAPAGPAAADGPAPCTVGGPPFPFAGFCATYSGDNTWYGSYGPGFPTDEGWGFCADPPASGGDYPAPDYDYVSSSAPAGANTSQAGALGFAFSEAQANGWWGGTPGQFTADQAAVAGKLLYDAVVWASPVPAMDPGVLAAYQALDGWFVQAVGSTGDPRLTARLVGGGTSFAGHASYQVHVQFPGSNNEVTGLPVQLSITGGTLNSISGPTSLTMSTDASGKADFAIFTDAPGPVSVAVTVPGGLGQFGLAFLAPTVGELGAQEMTAFSVPANSVVSEELTAQPTTGTVSIAKGGDDAAYYPLSGAVFQVLTGTSVVTTLTTGADGTTSMSGPITAGSYTVHEQTAPPGYGTAPDQAVTVVAGTNTVVSFTGSAEDHVVPSSLSIEKTDAETSAPLSGAVFDISYDSANDGTFDQDVGSCTTTSAGSCTPQGNDGSGQLLPGRYQVTETSPPPGYALASPPTQVIDLLAGETGKMTFGDPLLVAAVFHKTATGNVNPTELMLAGVVIQIDRGGPGGPAVAQCASDASGTCVTAPNLSSGTHYCWVELASPRGLAGGASGCFTAANDLADQPITVTDPGEFVAIDVKKVDAADTAVGLSGATFDLYRLAGASSASAIAVPGGQGAGEESLVGTTTTGFDGLGTFPLQLPGYAYCAAEVQAPENYVGDTTQQCTDVLVGTTTVPAPVTTLTFDDTEAMVGLSVFKYNSLEPGTGIAGAVYDVYVQGAPPPSGTTGTPPADVAAQPGDTWYARGTTGSDGRLTFTVPAGYGWCVLEVTAPPNYVLDSALHCSAVLTASSNSQATTIAVPETLATVHITAYKYNSRQPDTVIPGATYELLANNDEPPGTPGDPPNGAVVPSGDHFWAEATTDQNGVLSFAVPAGFSWCLHELIAPAAYEADPAFHCTAVLTTDTTSAAATVAVPEVPLTGSLPFTGAPILWTGVAGVVLVILGGGLLLLDHRRAIRRRRGGRGGAQLGFRATTQRM
jgi:hypothetical protein